MKSVKSFFAKYKSLPIKNKKILGLSVVIFLALLIPLLLWGFFTKTFDLRKRAGGPVTPPNSIPLDWQTNSVRITADDFSIETDGKVFTGALSGITLTEEQSAVGNETRAKFTASYNKFRDNLKLEINFRTDNQTTWYVSSVRVYNRRYADKWVTYTNWPLETPLGEANHLGGEWNFGLIDPNTNRKIADVRFTNLSIQGFTNIDPNPDICKNNPFTLELSPQTQSGTPGQTVRYSVRVTNPNTACTPYTTHLIVDKPSHWTAVFGTPDFILAGNHTYDTYLDVTSSASDTIAGQNDVDVQLAVRVSTEQVGNMGSGTVIYRLIQQGAGECELCGGIAGIQCAGGLVCTLDIGGHPDQSGICVKPDGSSQCTSPSPTPEPTTSPSPEPIPGDVNQDGHVNIVDIGIIIDNYKMTDPDDPRADVNGDGFVNIVDIGIIIDNYGR